MVGLAAAGAGVAVSTQPVGAATAEIRVSTAGAVVKDAAGALWSARRGFVGGRTSAVLPASVGIRGTTAPQLYRAGVWGMTGFSQPVTTGTYTVTLLMSENVFNRPGARVFSVTAEGRPVLSNIDIYRAVGYRTAYNRSFTLPVTDGTLNLGFSSRVNLAEVQAIRITPVAATTPAPAPVPVPAARPGRPGPTNTGVPKGTVLTKHVGDLVVTTPGVTISNLDIYGYVTIQAPNVTIKNSRVHGGPTPAPMGSYALVTDVSAKATNFVLQDSELFPDHPNMWIDGIKGFNYTLDRVNIHSTVDTAKIYGNNATIRNSWLHDTIYYTNDPRDAGGHTHNDGVQVLSGSNIHIYNNTITGSNNAAMQVTQNHGAVNGLWFQNNYADGGGCSVNLSHYPLPSMSGVYVTNNRFGHNTRVANCPIISGPGTFLSAISNVWDDNGLPALVHKGL